MSRYRIMFVPLALAVSQAACGILGPVSHSQTDLGRLKLGDDRNAVIAVMGRPDTTRANSTGGEAGKPIIVDEYHLYESGTPAWQMAMCIPTLTIACWMPLRDYSIYTMTYVNDKLAQFGRAGDWQK